MKLKTTALITLLICLLTPTGIRGESIPSANTTIYKKGFHYQPIDKKIAKRILGKSYTKNNDISLSDLRYVTVKHYNYKGKVVSGELIVNKKIAGDITKIFYELYKLKYPIQSMKLIDEYGGDDVKSMTANNTSAFNYREIAGSKKLSNHAYGMAIDINPRINPYVTKNGKIVIPENGKIYANRDVKTNKGAYKNNMIHKNDSIYRIFKKYGFTWGGDWNSSYDYQHFEKRT